MRSSDRRQKLISYGTMAAPAALVLLAAMIFGSGPSAVDASGPAPVQMVAPPILSAAAEVTEAQRDSAAHVLRLAGEPFRGNPMYYEPRRSGDPTPDPTPSNDPVYTPLNANVSMVMRSSSGSIALINGRPYRVGQHIDDGPWKVTAIDSDTSSVIMVNQENGEEHTASVPLPE